MEALSSYLSYLGFLAMKNQGATAVVDAPGVFVFVRQLAGRTWFSGISHGNRI
jgi:hypothetical protein